MTVSSLTKGAAPRMTPTCPHPNRTPEGEGRLAVRESGSKKLVREKKGGFFFSLKTTYIPQVLTTHLGSLPDKASCGNSKSTDGQMSSLLPPPSTYLSAYLPTLIYFLPSGQRPLRTREVYGWLPLADSSSRKSSSGSLTRQNPPSEK